MLLFDELFAVGGLCVAITFSASFVRYVVVV